MRIRPIEEARDVQDDGPQYQAMSVDDRGPVREITLSRPELLNRFDETLERELADALGRAREEPGVRAVLLASTGRVFSAGGDFDQMRRAQADPATRRATVDGARRTLDTLLALPQPLVVALHGPAIGLGATVVLAGDAVVAGPSASLADPHVSIGLVAGDGGCLFWPQAVGMVRAKRHLLTGDALDAAEAHRFGLVSDLVDTTDDVLPTARALADRLAAQPPLAVMGTKRALNAVLRQRASEVFELALAHEEQTLASTDLLEAIAAFEEKRPPHFEGR